MRKKVLLDMDGVIANFYHGFANYLNKSYGCSLDLDDEPNIYEFEGWGRGTENINIEEATLGWIKNDGFKKLPAIDGASEFVNELNKICSVYLVTARVGDWNQDLAKYFVNKIKIDTQDWIEENKISVKKVYFSHEKIPFCKKHGIGLIIEDKLETVLDAACENIPSILINKGYNSDVDGDSLVHRVCDLKEALKVAKDILKS